jgi:hypothetical protein
MGIANYKICGHPGEWHIEHDGKVANTYETKSAFEAAAPRHPLPCAKAMRS